MRDHIPESSSKHTSYSMTYPGSRVKFVNDSKLRVKTLTYEEADLEGLSLPQWLSKSPSADSKSPSAECPAFFTSHTHSVHWTSAPHSLLSEHVRPSAACFRISSLFTWG